MIFTSTVLEGFYVMASAGNFLEYFTLALEMRCISLKITSLDSIFFLKKIPKL